MGDILQDEFVVRNRNLSISGRVVRADGRGIGGAYVRLAGGEGGEQLVLTNPFGYYRFAGFALALGYYICRFQRRGMILIGRQRSAVGVQEFSISRSFSFRLMPQR
ncbi:MAG: carboxypeptidase regulatory-like domain-containing protein [Acidobacteria bacterium]|nr:carboxypeptidase regulatory-like domain-containing protein [Acidobacteriota bacterium]